MKQPLFPSTIGTQSRFAYFLTAKAVVRKFGKSNGQTGSWCLDKAVLAQGGGGVGTRPWWLALLACGSTYWPLAFEPSVMTSRHPYYCGHLHCPGHPPSWVGIQNATSAHGVLP